MNRRTEPRRLERADKAMKSRRRERQQRRAVRLMHRADRLLTNLPDPQAAPRVVAALPSTSGTARRGLVFRTRGALVRRGIERAMSHPKAAEAAALVAGVAVGVVLVAVLVGTLIATAIREGEDW